MDALIKTLKQVQSRLDGAHVRSAVIGGLAVGVWGRPRLTDDVDLDDSTLLATFRAL